MKHCKWFLAAAFSLAVTGITFAQIGVVPKKDATLQDATDAKFKPGDVWQYATREGEEQSTLTVLKVDNSPELGVIVHIGESGSSWPIVTEGRPLSRYHICPFTESARR
jgi:hypothetical protein